MSVDFRLMFVYHGSMMVMMFLGQTLSRGQEILFTVVLVGILVSISLKHRARSNWHWPCIGMKEVLSAVATAVLITFFLWGASSFSPTLPPGILPWFLAGAGIGTFGILSSLKIVYASEADFLAQCRTIDQYGREIPRASVLRAPKMVEERWKRILRGIYTVAFFVVWILGVLSFHFDGRAFNGGSPVPTATQTEPMTEHGKTVYVTPAEKQRVDHLWMVSWVGFPCLIAGGLILHFVVGVKVFSNYSNIAER